MKKSITRWAVILSGFLPAAAFAQNVGAVKPGIISGKLADQTSKEPIGFASVALHRLPDSVFVKGIASDITGLFRLENVNEGNYFLKVSMVGYTNKVVPGIALTPTKPSQDLGIIAVATDAKKLGEVQVIAQKDIIEHALDKQIINVGKDLSSVGGTASDALKNAPSVAVDIDGNVSVRGSSNVTVLIDGKNTGQTAQTILAQTPASAIEKIEVITNPGARYDAEGMGGIINLILKKETKPGLNGNVALNIGTYDNYNASLGLNYRYQKFNFFTGYDYRQFYAPGNYQLLRSTTFGESTSVLDQRQYGRRIGKMHIPKIGFDYQLSESQSLTVSVKYFTHRHNETETVLNNLENEVLAYENNFTRLGLTENNINVTDYSLSYRKTFAAKGKELSASAVYSDVRGNFDRYYNQFDTFIADPETRRKESFLQNFDADPLYAQLDYVNPIGEKGKVETGLKYSQRILTTRFISNDYDFSNEIYVVDPKTTNRFGYDEYVSAAYANYGNTWKKTSYQLGLRAEQTNIIVTDKGNNKKYRNQYLNAFPSLFLSQEINENLKLQLNYSRRLNRPNYEALNPFVNYSDPLNIWYGNPYLKPEYIDSYEGSYVYFRNNGSLTATGFYRQVHNVIQQVRQVVSADTANNTYVNLSDGSSYGVEMSGSQTLAKWLKLSGNVSAFNYKISGTPLGVEATSSKFSWLTRINGNFTFTKGLSGQLSFNYRSPQALAQGTRAALYNTDASLKKDILNKKGALTLRVSDIFNTLQWDTNISGDGLVYDLHTKRQTRIVTFGFSYRFGEQDKRRRQEADGAGSGLF